MPEPHYFTYPNGALPDNSKSNACKILKGMVNTEVPQNSNTVHADGMFPIQSTLHCLNYSIFVQKVVLSVLSDLCFDVYESLSKTQKDKKQERGNEKSDRVFYIGPKTKMETDMYDLP